MILQFKKSWTITEQNFDTVIFDIVDDHDIADELQNDSRDVGIINTIRDYCNESDDLYFMNWGYSETDISGESPIVELFLL